MSKKLCKAIKGLKKVIKLHEENPAERLDMNRYANCALGHYANKTFDGMRLSGFNVFELSNKLFGFGFTLATGFNTTAKDNKKWKNKLTRLFSDSTNASDSSEWLHEAYQVLEDLEKRLVDKQVAKLPLIVQLRNR